MNQAYNNDTISTIFNSLSPIKYTIIECLLVILYFNFLSVLYNVCNLIFNKRILSFLTIILIILLGFSLGTGFIRKILFTSNLFIMNSELNEVINGTYIIYKFVYWFVLIIITYFIGLFLVKKRDNAYGK